MNAEQIMGIINRNLELFLTYLLLTVFGSLAIVLIVKALGLGWIGFIVSGVAIHFFAKYMGRRSGAIVREREGL